MTSNQHRQSEPNQDAEPCTDEWVGNDPDYVKCEDCQAWANVDDVQDRYNHDPDCPKFRDCAQTTSPQMGQETENTMRPEALERKFDDGSVITVIRSNESIDVGIRYPGSMIHTDLTGPFPTVDAAVQELTARGAMRAEMLAASQG